MVPPEWSEVTIPSKVILSAPENPGDPSQNQGHISAPKGVSAHVSITQVVHYLILPSEDQQPPP